MLGLTLPAQAQFGKKKEKEKTDKPEKKKKFGAKLKKFGNKVKSDAQRSIGNAMTKATDDLSNVSMTVAYKQNMYPEDMIGNASKMKWEAGQSIVFSNFTNKGGAGLVKIKGGLKLDGNPLAHSGMGIYGVVVEDQPEPHQIAVETESGQSAEVAVKPTASLKIISINGVPKGEPITLNAREDLTLELEHGAGAEGTNVSVSFIGKIPGTTWLYDIAIVGSNGKLTIPKEAFVNPHGGGFKYLEDNYLVVSRNVEEVLNVDGVGAIRTVSSYLDWTPVTLKSDFDKNFLGQTVETADAINAHVEHNNIQGRISKPNAFLGQPLEEGKKIAVASFVVRATKLSQKREYDYSYKTTKFENTTEGAAIVTTTTDVNVKESSTFPKVSEQEWEKLVEEFYVDFEKELLEKWNITLVPIEKTMKSPSYNNLIAIGDKLTDEVMVKGYKGSSLLIPTSFAEFGKSMTTTFPSDLTEVRLMRELGVDGIIGVTIDCEMSYGDGALAPRMAIQITGLPNGFQAGPTVFMRGVFSGKDDLITAFGQTIDLMKVQEEEKKYDVIWDLKELD